jgi:ABC-type uncharacterized transport system permease subunit
MAEEMQRIQAQNNRLIAQMARLEAQVCIPSHSAASSIKQDLHRVTWGQLLPARALATAGLLDGQLHI